jgi:hypothetical protein
VLAASLCVATKTQKPACRPLYKQSSLTSPNKTLIPNQPPHFHLPPHYHPSLSHSPTNPLFPNQPYLHTPTVQNNSLQPLVSCPLPPRTVCRHWRTFGTLSKPSGTPSEYPLPSPDGFSPVTENLRDGLETLRNPLRIPAAFSGRFLPVTENVRDSLQTLRNPLRIPAALAG